MKFQKHVYMAEETGDPGGGGLPSQPGLFGDTILGSDHPPAPVSDSPSVETPGGSNLSDWRQSVPTDLADHPALKSIESYDQLIKGYVEAKDAASNMVAVPGADAKPEDWDSFYTKIGRPEKIEDYNASLKEEGFEWADGSEGLQKAVFEAGLTASQVAQLSKAIGELGASQQAASEKTQDNVIQALRGEWGKNFDQRLGLAQEAVKRFGTDGINEMLTETGAGNHPAFIKMMSQIGQTLADEGMIDGQSFGVMSKEDAAREAERITALPAYSDPNDADHDRLVEEATRLFNIAYAGEPIQS